MDVVKEVVEDVNLKNQLTDLQSVMNDMETEHYKTNAFLSGMREVLDTMSKAKSCDDKGVQVGDGQLFWDWYPIPLELPYSNQNSYYYIMQERAQIIVPSTRPRTPDPVKWNPTPEIMHFLANSPGRFPGQWDFKDVKKAMFEICKMRMEMSSELHGFMQPNILLDEVICLYFMTKRQQRRLAESRVKEFLASLRSYYERRGGAKIFSRVSGMAGNMNDNNDYIWCDLYT